MAAASPQSDGSNRSGNGNGAPRPSPTRGGRRAGEASGTLVLIGGGCSAQGDALGTFVRCSKGNEGGRIVGFTTASADPMGAALAWRSDLKTAGATNVEIPLVDNRNAAQDERIAQMVREADGIFLGGGDQVHLVATIGGSRVGNAMRDAYRRGAVICGTSAGSAALTETILAGGEVDEMGKNSDMHIGPGLGLLGFRAMIDTHFAQRRRLHRLFVAIAANPDLMGLGIDEDTALVVRGHLGEVVGKGSVTFVDGRGVRFDNADEVKTGSQLTLSYLRVGLVGPGYEFNLRERELECIVQGKHAPVPSVKGETAAGSR
ncbi:MAG TPA: cyanophycinase [Gemmatimonadaceae bacterium]|jgi:cyanophycinase|nr:cyanophycinase [Gemmatimonadaceae bacterium]